MDPAQISDPSYTGAEMLIHLLRREGVDTIFGYPGGAVLPIYDALYDCSDIRHILTRHEQAAVHAADGYARVTGKPGVVLVTSGPGATNAITGIANAFMDSVPLIVLTGQVPTSLIGLDSFQETDTFGMTMSITKHNYLVLDTCDLPRIIKEAFYIATTGRPGPVLIDLPKNVMTAKSRLQFAGEARLRGYRPEPECSSDDIRLMARKINEADKPVFMIGGGVASAGASRLFHEIAETTNIPVVTTLMGIGSFPSRHPLHLGMVGMHGTFAANKAVHQADVLISLGVRFSDRVVGNKRSFAPHAYKIHVDIDPAELGKNVSIDLPIAGGLSRVLTELSPELQPVLAREWTCEAQRWRKRVPRAADTGSLLKPQDVIRLIDEMSGGDAIVATDVGQHQIWTAQHYEFARPRSFLTSGGSGTMGFGFPAAIGTALAAPGREVICISGDGSFQMNLQELMTAVELRLPIRIAILNNGYLGMVRQWQDLFYKKRYSSVRLASPDFAALARSFGAAGFRVRTPDEARAALHSAFAASGPALVDFDVTEEENVYPIVPPGAGNQEMILPE